MSAPTKFKLLTLSAVLLLVAACGNEKKSSSSKKQQPQKNAVCEGISCMSSITWKILLQGQVFPEKSRVDINGSTVLDECLGKQQYRIDRASAPQSITLENYLVPKKNSVRVHIVDQGWDCSQETTFLYKDDVRYDIVKGTLGREIHISL